MGRTGMLYWSCRIKVSISILIANRLIHYSERFLSGLTNPVSVGHFNRFLHYEGSKLKPR